MAGDITLALRNAQSGLQVNQAALDAVAQNIANSNSEGYSRKIIQLEQRVVAGTGAGVQIAQVQRAVDEQLLKSMRLETSTLNNLNALADYYERTQQLFGTPGDNTSIAHMMGEFAASIEVLAGSPDQTQNQSEVIRQAELIEDKFRSLSEDIQELRVQAEQEITTTVNEINGIITEISSLNDTIVRQDSVGNDVSDLLDKRDIQLNKLSEYLDITYFSRGDNQVIVYTQAGRTLVDEISSTLTHSQTFGTSALHSHDGGHISGIYVGAETGSNDITNELIDGKLKALVDMRDDFLPDLQAQLDELASEMSSIVNQVHNRGNAFPGSSALTGTRNFVDSATSTITFSGDSDTWIAVTDSSGNQQAMTSLRTLLGGNSDTIDNVATAIQTWLTGTAGVAGATVSVNSDGHFEVDLNSSSNYISFRDQASTVVSAAAEVTFNDNGAGSGVDTIVAAAGRFSSLSAGDTILVSNATAGGNNTTYTITNVSADGSTLTILEDVTDSGGADANAVTFATPGKAQSDATILYDVNADSTTDQTVSGFANFFGLNDLFVDNLPDVNWESDIMATTYNTTTLTTIEFRDSTGAIAPAVTFGVGSSLQDMADEINAQTWPANRGVTASVVSEGSGERLRLSYDAGSNMEVYATSGSELTSIGMHVANTGASAAIQVRSDIAASPALLSRGALLWDANKGVSGEFYNSLNDETVASQMASAFATKNAFETAGGLKNLNLTFHEYAASIIGYNSDLADANSRTQEYQVTLTETLQFKARTESGVNLDEEMSNLILYEQAYSAIARVVSTVKSMFDALQNIV